jgi:hypothetical protein
MPNLLRHVKNLPERPRPCDDAFEGRNGAQRGTMVSLREIQTLHLAQKTLRYSMLVYATLRYSTLLCATLCYSTLLYATLRYSTLLYATLC